MLLLVVMAALAVGATSAPSPASAATLSTDNGATQGLWVDGSGRLHALVSAAPITGSTQVDQLRVVRHQAGSTTLDGTFGTGGPRTLSLVNPYRWDSDGPGLFARVSDSTLTADGTVVVAWLATGYVVRSATGTCSGSPCQKTVNEYDHASDRLVIDRYDLAGTRLSRFDVALPRNAWCANQYGEQRWLADFNIWDRAVPEYCGAYDRIPANIEVLASGAVAVPTYGVYEYPPAGGDPVGNSSVAFFSSSTGAVLRIVTMASSRVPAGGITGSASGGAVFATSDTHGAANPTPGPTYVVPTTWGTPTPTSPGAGCGLWAGPGGSTVRTCIDGGSLTVTVLDASGGTTWSRSVPAIDGVEVTRVAAQPDGRISVVAFGCEDPLATCPDLSQVALRVGSSGAIARFALAPLLSGSTFTYVWQARVALPGGAQAVALDARTGTSTSIETRLLGAPVGPSVPGAPSAPGAVAGDRQVRVSWSAPGSDGGSPVTGYRITPYRNGVALSPITVGNVTTRVVTGLDDGATYRFTVAAINAVGRGPESPTSPGVVPGALPAAPTNVRATGQRGQATVTWTAPPTIPGLPVTGYSMVVIADGVRLQAVDIGQGTTEVVTSLRAGVVYRFEVAARNAIGTGPSSSPSNTVTPTVAAYRSHDEAAKRLAEEVLGRAPTVAEATTWAGQMESGSRTPGALVADLRARSESTAKVDPAARLYTAYFLRRPDHAGLSYWIDRLRAGRSTRWVSDFFAGSREFQQRYGTLSNRQFVELIYANILGRPGEASGVEYWTGQLDSGARTRGWVMVGFSESAEYRRTQSSEVEVAVLYTLLLGRAPAAAEYSADVALLDGGTTIATLAQRLITSTEYTDRSSTP